MKSISKRWHFIYGLFSVNKNECFYIGMSCSPITRFHNHIADRKTRGKPLHFTILKRVKYRHAQREEAQAIARYKSIGQAKLNKSLCRNSLNRTVTNEEVIVFANTVKHGVGTFATDSDCKIITQYAGRLRGMKIRNISFKSVKCGDGFMMTAIVRKLEK